jgi:chorismate mutase
MIEPSMTARHDKPDPLEDVRRRIDVIDDDIAELLGARFDLVQEVKRVKGLAGQGDAPALRPAREAQILRRLVAGHAHKVPARTLIGLWCEIMISATQVQSAFKVHRPTRGQASRLQDIVRLRFGSQVPVVEHATFREVLEAVAASTSDLGILPASTSDDGLVQLPASGIASLIETADRDVRIVASLPLWTDEAQTGAWIIGKSAFEASGDDATVFAASRGEMSLNDGIVSLGETRVETSFAGTVEVRGETWCIYAAGGFVPQSEEGLAALRAFSGGDEVRHLGGYPNAIDIGGAT